MDSDKAFLLVKPKVLSIAAVIISGIFWYFSNGLIGDFWYLLWLAPIPVLLISLKISAKQSFLIAFIAYLIGRLSWFSYLVLVATWIPAIIFTLLPALLFALIILVSRKAILKLDSWMAVFVFPVLFTTYEFILFNLSADGTATSIAYSQSNVLPVIQIISLTGILGITFLVTFVPSAITLGWHYRNQKNQSIKILTFTAVIMVAVISFGIIRLERNSDMEGIKAGLIVLDEKQHTISQNPDFQKELTLAAGYVKEISILAGQGAELILLPERAININAETELDIIGVFGTAARQNNVWLVIGYTNFRGDHQRNSALILNSDGKIVSDYHKVHLVTGLENQFTPGDNAGLFTLHDQQTGISICKDLDFPGFIREYGKQDVALLLVPAWDFEVDDWLHSRMAILRGIEFGFSEIRAARQGRLTISDYCGRVVYETSCSKGQKASLTGKTAFQNQPTFYASYGSWFGIVNLLAGLTFLIFIFLNQRNNN